jgi:hypothetical protein
MQSTRRLRAARSAQALDLAVRYVAVLIIVLLEACALQEPYPATWPALVPLPAGECPPINGTYQNAGVWAGTGKTILLTKLLLPPGPSAPDAEDVSVRVADGELFIDAASPSRGIVHARLRISPRCKAGHYQINDPAPGEIEGLVTAGATLRISAARDNSLVVQTSRTNVGLLVYTETVGDWSRFESTSARSNKSLERSRDR